MRLRPPAHSLLEAEASCLSLAKAMAALEEHMKGVEKWAEQTSLHCHRIEMRMMQTNYLAHDVVREISALLVDFCPCALRRVEDHIVLFVRSLFRSWSCIEGGDIVRNAYRMSRLLVEESVRRGLVGMESEELREAFGVFIDTLRKYEQVQKSSTDVIEFGVFATLTPLVLVDIVEAVRENRSTFKDLPSHRHVMSAEFGPMRSELMSMHIISDQAMRDNQGLSLREANLLLQNAGRRRHWGPYEAGGWREGNSSLQRVRLARSAVPPE